jgi:hypothetical protein
MDIDGSCQKLTMRVGFADKSTHPPSYSVSSLDVVPFISSLRIFCYVKNSLPICAYSKHEGPLIYAIDLLQVMVIAQHCG